MPDQTVYYQLSSGHIASLPSSSVDALLKQDPSAKALPTPQSGQNLVQLSNGKAATVPTSSLPALSAQDKAFKMISQDPDAVEIGGQLVNLKSGAGAQVASTVQSAPNTSSVQPISRTAGLLATGSVPETVPTTESQVIANSPITQAGYGAVPGNLVQARPSTLTEQQTTDNARSALQNAAFAIAPELVPESLGASLLARAAKPVLKATATGLAVGGSTLATGGTPTEAGIDAAKGVALDGLGQVISAAIAKGVPLASKAFKALASEPQTIPGFTPGTKIPVATAYTPDQAAEFLSSYFTHMHGDTAPTPAEFGKLVWDATDQAEQQAQVALAQARANIQHTAGEEISPVFTHTQLALNQEIKRLEALQERAPTLFSAGTKNNLALGTLEDLQSSIQAGRYDSLAQLDDLRSALFDINKNNPGSVSEQTLKRLTSAVHNDIKESLRPLGDKGDDLFSDFQSASNHMRKFLDATEDSFIKNIINEGKREPEKIFSIIMQAPETKIQDLTEFLKGADLAPQVQYNLHRLAFEQVLDKGLDSIPQPAQKLALGPFEQTAKAFDTAIQDATKAANSPATVEQKVMSAVASHTAGSIAGGIGGAALGGPVGGVLGAAAGAAGEHLLRIVFNRGGRQIEVPAETLINIINNPSDASVVRKALSTNVDSSAGRALSDRLFRILSATGFKALSPKAVARYNTATGKMEAVQ
jgi:hypothetical protein